MPVLGGLDLIKEIKNSNLQVPCIAVSANEDEAIKQKALELGFDGFISKVLSYKDLSSQISFVINRQHLLDKK
jgi:DNA-binding NarL/FixJ family response regulator